MDIYAIIKKSKDTAEADPIVLRQTETTCLVFKPTVVNNIQDPHDPVKGCFVFQKKKINDSWEDHNTVPLSHLKAGEWIKLELKAGELHKLLSHVAGLYRLYHRQGLPRGKTHFLKLMGDEDDIQNLRNLDIVRLLGFVKRTDAHVVANLLEWVANLDNAAEIIDQLERLEINCLKRINSLVGLTTLKALLQLWEENRSNGSEEFWQRTLQQYAFVLFQVFAFPIVFFRGKAYVGGKGLDNTGGHIVDFLYANQLTSNAVLVEIKTPMTKLLGRQYRGGAYSVSDELSGAISQVLTNRHSLLREFSNIGSNYRAEIEAFSPCCMVLAGHTGRELTATEQLRSFELFRGALNNDVFVLTFDELFAKTKALLGLLEGPEL